jgi:hypothetical protein
MWKLVPFPKKLEELIEVTKKKKSPKVLAYMPQH